MTSLVYNIPELKKEISFICDLLFKKSIQELWIWKSRILRRGTVFHKINSFIFDSMILICVSDAILKNASVY